MCVLTTGLLSGRFTQASDPPGDSKFVDLSLLVSPSYPGNWPAPAFQPFRMDRYLRIGPDSPYNSEILAIDENTGTQFDAPAHSISPPDSGFPTAGPLGLITGDKVPAWQFFGEACVIDCEKYLDTLPAGRSDLVTPEHVAAWEAKHRKLQFGDVALFRSGFSDQYFQPLPAGRRFLADPFEGKTAAWPDPSPECMALVAERGVKGAGTDSPSMGPLPGPVAVATHLAGLKHGMIWTEGAIGLGQLPPTGALYVMLPVRHAGGAGAETRAFGVIGPLAKRLIESAKKRQVVDLSLTLDDGYPLAWPGVGAGNHRHIYWRKTQLTFEETNGNGFAQAHFMDSHAGTHLVPPSYALPAPGEKVEYSPEVQKWLAAYEKKYGPRGTSDVTTEQVPIEQTCGSARVIDVSSLIGTTDQKSWPSSPEITADLIRADEKKNGDLRPGDIVIFHSGWSDKYYNKGTDGDACLLNPINGKSEGWPAPGAEAIQYLASKGIRCVGTDGPTLGGANPQHALATYWMLGGKGMVGVEYLTNVSQLPKGGYFVFAATKIEGCHGGPGRAVAAY